LDKATQRQLARGERLVELLKQDLHQTMPVELQVVSIFAGTRGFLDGLRVAAVRPFEAYLHDFVKVNAPQVLETIVATGKLEGAIEEQLQEACQKAVAAFLREHPEAAVA
jgi:F-type H+-transporting ATPase subunit alpha